MPTGQQVVDLARKYVGYAYSQGPTRTTGQDGYFDCSGFTYFLVHTLGGGTSDWQTPEIAQSHLQALSCRDHGTLTTFDHAISTPGALLFEGPDNAYIGGAGIPGHVVVSMGNRQNTIEAMGHQWGVTIGNVFGRNWSNYGLIPGYSYSGASGTTPGNPNAPAPEEEEVAGLQSIFVYDAGFPFPELTLDTKNRKALTYHNAKITWDGGAPPANTQHQGTHDPFMSDIPGAEPLVSLQVVSRGTKNVKFVISGLAGGQYIGELHL